MPSLTLYFKEGASDKVYQATLGDDGTVLTSWGRRGGPQQSQSFGPLPIQEAAKLYDKKVNEKLAKGYQPGAAGLALVRTAGTTAPANVPRPQLLNEIARDEVERLIRDPRRWMQEKYDGCRILLERNGDAVTAWSRTGKPCAALPGAIVEAALAIPAERFLIDGEIIGDTVWAFDLIPGATNIPDWAYELRWIRLSGLLLRSPEFPAIRLAPTARTEKEKAAMLERIQSNGGEGVVLKDYSAPYTPGRPSSGGPALKFKFVKTASVIVESTNTQRSVNVKAVCGTPLGRVTVPPNYPVPAGGAVCEVRYLTIHRGGALIQPVYLGERSDIPAEECTIDQLEFKSAVEAGGTSAA